MTLDHVILLVIDAVPPVRVSDFLPSFGSVSISVPQ